MLASIRDGWIGLRNRLAADPRFQSFAARFPLTRPFARREAADLFDLVSGFVYTQILLSVVELGLLEQLQREPMDLAAIAERNGLPSEAADILLKAATTLGLTQKLSNNRYAPGLKGASLLGNAAVMDLVRHHKLLYRDLAEPLSLLKNPSQPTELSQFWAYARNEAPDTLSDGIVSPYSALMATTQALVADEILDSYDVAKHRTLLDMGGGHGAFATAAAQRAPALSIRLFDLPAVAAEAAKRFAAKGLSGRATTFGGSFLDDDPPAGADLITLVRVLYDHPDEAARIILGRARQALAPGGTLLIGEPVAELPGAERMGHPYFGLYLLAMKGGRIRTTTELALLCREAGFKTASPLKTARPLMTGIVIARSE